MNLSSDVKCPITHKKPVNVMADDVDVVINETSSASEAMTAIFNVEANRASRYENSHAQPCSNKLPTCSAPIKAIPIANATTVPRYRPTMYCQRGTGWLK